MRTGELEIRSFRARIWRRMCAFLRVCIQYAAATSDAVGECERHRCNGTKSSSGWTFRVGDRSDGRDLIDRRASACCYCSRDTWDIHVRGTRMEPLRVFGCTCKITSGLYCPAATIAFLGFPKRSLSAKKNAQHKYE